MKPARISLSALLIVVLSLALVQCSQPDRDAEPGCYVRFTVPPPPGHRFTDGQAPVLSDDGSRLVFAAEGEDRVSSLWVQSVVRSVTGNHIVAGATAPASRIPGTVGGQMPFWSPDGERLGYFANGTLKLVSADTGAVLATTPASDGGGGSWHRNGAIVFSSAGRGIFTVPDAGGAPRQLTILDAGASESAHVWPAFLPDGRHFLYTAVNPSTSALRLGSLTSSESLPLSEIASQSEYVTPGLLVSAQNSLLWEYSFSPKTFVMGATRRQLAHSVKRYPSGLAAFTVSGAGNLMVYWRSGARQMSWVDANGTEIGQVPDAGEYLTPRISPGGDDIAASLVGSGEIYVYSRKTGQWRMVTDGQGRSSHPVWMKDGTGLVFVSRSSSGAAVHVVPGDGRGISSKLFDVPFVVESPSYPTSISADGTLISLVDLAGSATGRDIRVVTAQGSSSLDERTVWRRQSPMNEWDPALSPDGQWVAFVMCVTCETVPRPSNWYPEIHVARLSAQGAAGDFVLGAGAEPVWSSSAEELYFRRGSTIVAVKTVGPPEGWAATSRIVLDDEQLQVTPFYGPPSFDVNHDGSRLLVLKQPAAAGPSDFEGLMACTSGAPAIRR